MSIEHISTTTQVLLKVKVEFSPVDFIAPIKARSALIKKAVAHWGYSDGRWNLESVYVWGPVVRKADGQETSKHVAELTHPPFDQAAKYRVVTPPELVELALQHAPTWEPEINATHYPRIHNLRSSL
ncbi:hypothetical protein WG915_09525 [Corynebacterium sp. H128]|uniref:hypothetical protein n=1 Tax=Corynebacterium sp. H128 TaxID=3133427 RepID=UPI0030A54CE3